ncbi:restriction endonuclease [Acidimicrobiia bacterium EGI L10123]|uniref:NaeI family type II restriction endonuclease n=1 Tax=Salinilacustrithrix flava TaxID=2957203 RepID=UPI003D7C29D4|nr:restriction endonuclease [Acidimicrobiia bacterium EGI L10123]
MGTQRTPKPLRMSKPTFPDHVVTSASPTAAVAPVASWLLAQPSVHERFRWVLRDSVDQLLDGQHTGRWNYLHLSKTEKTHLGTIIEISLTKEFEIPDGHELDWRIAGIEVDCKFSKDYGKWEIPREMYLSTTPAQRSGTADHVALLVWLDDDRSRWAAGLLQITDALLSGSANGDAKRKLNDTGLKQIHWLWGGRQDDLPPNQLLHMSDAARQRVFGASSTSGQRRINVLLREFNQQLVHRSTVLTVAQQDDGMKRPRDARLPRHLGAEGFLVLGHQDAHPYIAALLGLPVPTKGEFVPVRVTQVPKTDQRPKVHISGGWWAAAGPADPSGPAPRLPKSAPSGDWLTYLKA